MLTKPQNTLYFRAWGETKRALVAAGRTPAAAEGMRHDLHERVLGYDKPHAQMTNAEFDAILGAFRAISRADDVDAQLRQLEQPITRARRVAADSIAEIWRLKEPTETAPESLVRPAFDFQGGAIFSILSHTAKLAATLVEYRAAIKVEAGPESPEDAMIDQAFAVAVDRAHYLDAMARRICRRPWVDVTVQDLTLRLLPALTYYRNRLAREAVEEAQAATEGDPY